MNENEIKQIPTKDYSPGREKYEIIVIHWGDTTKIEQIDKEVLNPSRLMSYHYAIDGKNIHQYVAEENTAWHASKWEINRKSIGICINAGLKKPYTDEEYKQCADLCIAIKNRHPEITEITPHSKYTATRCPGDFDFNKLNQLIIENKANQTAKTPQNAPADNNTQQADTHYEFTRNLYPGLRKDGDVMQLQHYLKEKGFYPKETPVTGNYLTITKQAVTDFQIANGIVKESTQYGAGYCGPKTRYIINNK